MALKNTAKDIVKAGFVRVWLTEDESGPGRVPVYKGLMKFTDPSQSFGDIEKVEGPDPDRYDEFITISETRGAEEFPTFGIMGRAETNRSELLRLAKKKCSFDAQAHIGQCRNPQDFNGGWVKTVFFDRCNITEYSIENFGAISSDERAATNENATLVSRDFYERVRLIFSQMASSTVTRQIYTVDVLDESACGDCDISSDGSSIVFAVMAPSGSTPGTSPTLVFTEDKFATISTLTINSLLGNETPSDAEFCGQYYVVVSNLDNSLHYVSWEDVLNGVGAFAQVTTGFVASKAPNAIVSAGPLANWIVGDGGYVYKMAEPSQGVTVVDAGEATTQNLNDVDAYGDQHIVAVGDSNVIIVSYNGATVSLVTGPTAGVNLSAVAIKRKNYWIVGNESGGLWYTRNGGTSWAQTSLPIAATRIRDIQFCTNSVGTMAVDIAGTHSRLLGTIDGGNSWYVLPEGTGSIPANDIINQVACGIDPNYWYAGGLADDGTDGLLLKLDPA